MITHLLKAVCVVCTAACAATALVSCGNSNSSEESKTEKFEEASFASIEEFDMTAEEYLKSVLEKAPDGLLDETTAKGDTSEYGFDNFCEKPKQALVLYPAAQNLHQHEVVYAVEILADVQFQDVPARPRLSVHLTHPVLQTLCRLMAPFSDAASIAVLDHQLVKYRVEELVQASLHDPVRERQRHDEALLPNVPPQLAVWPQLIVSRDHARLNDKQVILQMGRESHNLGPVSLALSRVSERLK